MTPLVQTIYPLLVSCPVPDGVPLYQEMLVYLWSSPCWTNSKVLARVVWDKDITDTRKVCEIHFVKGCWNVNVVAHEVQHAVSVLLYKNSVLGYLPDPSAIAPKSRWNEVVCSLSGALVYSLVSWLALCDPDNDLMKPLYPRFEMESR